MARVTDKVAAPKNGNKAKPVVSKLGRDLQRIREKIIASGEKMLTRRELEREVANRRAGNFCAPPHLLPCRSRRQHVGTNADTAG